MDVDARGLEFMSHGVIFWTTTSKADRVAQGKAESVNWGMLMEQHKLGPGTDSVSADVFRRVADLAASGIPGNFSDGRDVSWRAAGRSPASAQCIRRTGRSCTPYHSAKSVSWELYGGPSAEPALGPVTYIHRASAAELPMAPLGHHLQDSTHTSFGVSPRDSSIDRIKLEASAFNGREPNEQRWSIQLAALDSWSTRASIAPARNWAAQYSIGRLEHPEALEPGSQWRQTVSVEYNRPLTHGGWATTLLWGRVHKIANGTNLNSYLLESTLNFRERNYAVHAHGTRRQRRTIPGSGDSACVSHRCLHVRWRPRPDSNRAWQLALGADVSVLLEAGRTRCELMETIRFRSRFSCECVLVSRCILIQSN